MARSMWTGALSFGLVNVPVKLFSAVEDKGVHFNQFQAGTGARVHNKRVAEGTDDEVPYEDVVKGYEVRKGEFVIVTPEDLAALELDEAEPLEGGVTTSARERKMAGQLIESLSTDWDPSRYRDTYRERVLALIEAKDKGEELVVEEAPERPEVADLMA